MICFLTVIGCHQVAVVQYTFTHKKYIEQHNRHKQYIEQHNSLIRKSAGSPYRHFSNGSIHKGEFPEG